MNCSIRPGALFTAIALATAAPLFGQEADSRDSLGAARTLYDSAEYEAALTALDRLSKDAITPDQARDRTLYRALCLLALNRRQDATSTIERAVEDEPFFRLTDDSMPPRLRALVEDVRRRVVPALAQRHYEAGKTFFETAEYAKALEEFTRAIRLYDDLGEHATDASVADTTILARAFRDLAERSAAVAATAPSAVAASPVETRSRGIVPPITISQEVPDYSSALRSRMFMPVLDGVIDIVIGQDGAVKSATLVERIHPLYDPLLLTAAKQWKYQPATRDGKPIEYVKRISVTVRAR